MSSKIMKFDGVQVSGLSKKLFRGKYWLRGHSRQKKNEKMHSMETTIHLF